MVSKMRVLGQKTTGGGGRHPSLFRVNCSVPRLVGLTGILAEKVPNIASIKGTTISLHSR